MKITRNDYSSYLVCPQFRAGIRRRPHRRRYAAAGAVEDDPTERHPDQVHARQPASHHSGRKLVSPVSSILPTLSGRGQEVGHIAGRTVHARRVHHEYGESVASADTGGS